MLSGLNNIKLPDQDVLVEIIWIIQHFNFQLMHTTLKNTELLKHFKIRKTAPECFGLQGNHHQGATVST
jgi:hypothetical protein